MLRLWTPKPEPRGVETLPTCRVRARRAALRALAKDEGVDLRAVTQQRAAERALAKLDSFQ